MSYKAILDQKWADAKAEHDNAHQLHGTAVEVQCDEKSNVQRIAACMFALKEIVENINTDKDKPMTDERQKEAKELFIEASRSLVQAAATIQKKEDVKTKASRLTPLTKSYELASGVVPVDVVPKHKEYKLPDFTGHPPSGAKDDTRNRTEHCLGWLKRFISLCSVGKYSYDVALSILDRHVVDQASLVIAEPYNRTADPSETRLKSCMVALETTYAGLKHPDVAMEECRRATRREGEDILQMSQRIHHLARMATRDRANQKDAETERENLATTSFMSMLHPRVKEQLHERIAARRRQGEDDPTFTALALEANEIEEKRIATQQVYKTRYNTAALKAPLQAIHRMQEDDTDADDCIGGEDFEEEDESQAYRVEAGARRVTRPPWARPPAARGFAPRVRGRTRPTVPPRPAGRGTGRGGWRNPFTRNRSDEYVRFAEQEYVEEDEPEEYTTEEYYEDDQEYAVYAVQRTKITAAMVGVSPDECMRCGLKGHRAFGSDSKTCPLRDEYVTSQPCAACKKGGHLAARCPRQVDVPKN